MIIPVPLRYQQLSRIFSIFNYLTLIPFCSATLSYVYSDRSLCMVTTLNDTISLYSFLFHDAYIKLGILAIGLFIVGIRRETQYNKLAISGFGTMLMMYWLFAIGWYVAGGVLYWAHVNPNLCSDSLNAYMWALLIANYILALIGIILSRFRPSEGYQETRVNMLGNETRRETQMSKY